MEERLQKILARGGLASRRAAEKLITEGKVRVNGRVVSELGAKADPRKDKIEVDGARVIAERLVYVALHKPRGYVSTMSDPEGRPCVKELLGAVGVRVFPIGRLDFATSGLLLATNDGAFSDGLLHPKREVPKTYIVKTHGLMQPEDLERWRTGVNLEDGVTAPAEATLIRHEADKTWMELTIHEGRNQQIRRMGDATGFSVMRLSRVVFAGVTLEGLKPGAWRFLTRDELTALKKAYGVPRTIVSPPMPDAKRKAPTSRAGAQPSRGRGPSAGGERERTGGPRGRGPSAGGERERERTGGPRGRGPSAGGERERERTGGPRGRGPSAGGERGRGAAGPGDGRGRGPSGPPRARGKGAGAGAAGDGRVCGPRPAGGKRDRDAGGGRSRGSRRG
jgi:23S rRNA pseudouridine2605 synthase